MKRILLAAILCISSFCQASEVECVAQRVYMATEELDMENDAFMIHIGGNEWIETNMMYRDATGLYTYDNQIKTSVVNRAEYEKKWRCPYCYNYWPEGKACGNAKCPSKYKD